ncbi:hypothetical protein HY643_00925 [Candidatus Woesearchaeota archaeon]|nr:hypothetical protein [Candidatus Woesearchaeota archaeon]
MLAFIVNFVDDTMVHWIPLKVALAVVLGFLWMTYILASPANVILKIFAAPVFLFLGTIWGLIPFPIPLDFYTYIIRHRTYANLICAVATIPVLLIIGGVGMGIGFESLCGGLNSMLQILNQGLGQSLWQWMLSYF